MLLKRRPRVEGNRSPPRNDDSKSPPALPRSVAHMDLGRVALFSASPRPPALDRDLGDALALYVDTLSTPCPSLGFLASVGSLLLCISVPFSCQRGREWYLTRGSLLPFSLALEALLSTYDRNQGSSQC